MPAWSAGCVRSIVALSDSGSRESASNVSPAWVKKSDCSFGERRDYARRVAELVEEAPEPRVAVGKRARDRLEVLEEARELLDSLVEVGAASGERGAEARGGRAGSRAVSGAS